ncbi:MAG: phage tail protein [Cryomorphaceae bacterium]
MDSINYTIMPKEVQDNKWPLPKFFFFVQFGLHRKPVLFQEVSGLETEGDAIEYRHGGSPVFSTVKMPGLSKSGNVTLKKGVFKKDNNFMEWYDAIKMNTVKRETVTIQLSDEQGNPTMTWKLLNAWPMKISALDFLSDEVAIETLELAHEGFTIANG